MCTGVYVSMSMCVYVCTYILYARLRTIVPRTCVFCNYMCIRIYKHRQNQLTVQVECLMVEKVTTECKSLEFGTKKRSRP